MWITCLPILLGEERINQPAEVVYSGNSGRFWAVQGLINTGDVDKLPNLWLYVGITGLYLIILGPGLYLFLRGRGLLRICTRKGVGDRGPLAFRLLCMCLACRPASALRSTPMRQSRM